MRQKDLFLKVFLVAWMASATSLGLALEYIEGDASNPYVPETGIFAPNEAQVYIPLSGEWTIANDGKARAVTVPGCWPMGRNEVVLRRGFMLPDTLENRHFRLVLWGARQKLTIRLNSRLVEASEGDWPSLAVDIPSDLLRFGEENSLEIEITDNLSAKASIPLKPRLYDDLFYAGLFADIALLAGPAVELERLEWKYELDERAAKASYTLGLQFRNKGTAHFDSSTVKQISAVVRWTAPDGTTEGGSEAVELEIGPVEAGRVEISGTIPSPMLWSPDSPNLYSFRIQVGTDASPCTFRFNPGFARTEWTPEGLRVNGTPYHVRGIDLRQENRRHGRAMPLGEIAADLERIKRLGFNMVIFSEPPHPATTGLCDRLGLFVVPHTGLNNVPAHLFTSSQMQTRLKNTLLELVRRESIHVSVAGWGVSGGLAMKEEVLRAMDDLRSNMDADLVRPLIAGFLTNETGELPEGLVGVRQRPPYILFEPVEPVKPTSSPWLIGGLGGFAAPSRLGEDSTLGQVRQSDALLHHLEQVKSMPSAGFVIDRYSDSHSAWPMMIAGAQGRPNLVMRGLLTIDREDRIARRKAADALSQARIDVPVVRVNPREFPVVFPITAIVIAAILLISRRQNNVFRQNLNRVFAHTNGFFQDIRDRRYFQVSQTLLIVITISVSQGSLVAGYFHYARDRFLFDYFLTLFLPFQVLKAMLVRWAWHPPVAILGFTLIHIVLFIIIALLVRFFALPFQGRLSYRQAFNMVSWGASHFILLVPLGLVHYRLLSYTWYIDAWLILTAVLTFWYLLRISSMIRISCRVSRLTAWGLIAIVAVVVLGVGIWIYEGGFALLENLEHYSTVIIPWAQT